ncbi:MAG: MurR/RpiR family transcriptional regulator, partial [Hoeflea sp.]|nr:MurR/RpiR family transcriptional regulator [Hoeflea sp.]
MDTIANAFSRAVEELSRVAGRLDEAQIEAFIQAIIRARRIFLIGVG